MVTREIQVNQGIANQIKPLKKIPPKTFTSAICYLSLAMVSLRRLACLLSTARPPVFSRTKGGIKPENHRYEYHALPPITAYCHQLPGFHKNFRTVLAL